MAEKQSITLRRKLEGRGIFLTTMIILELIMLAPFPYINTFTADTTKSASAYNIPSWYSFLEVLDPFIMAAILIGVFFWKRLAVYGLFLFMGLNVLINIILFNSVFSEMLTTIIPGVLFVFILWMWAIERKWHLFT